MLLALPTVFLPVESLQESPEAATSHLGLFTTFTVPALQEFDGGDVAPAGFDMDVLVVDVQSEALPFLTLASQELHAEVQPFLFERCSLPRFVGGFETGKRMGTSAGIREHGFLFCRGKHVTSKVKAAAKKPAVEKARLLLLWMFVLRIMIQLNMMPRVQ